MQRERRRSSWIEPRRIMVNSPNFQPDRRNVAVSAAKQQENPEKAAILAVWRVAEQSTLATLNTANPCVAGLECRTFLNNALNADT